MDYEDDEKKLSFLEADFPYTDATARKLVSKYCSVILGIQDSPFHLKPIEKSINLNSNTAAKRKRLLNWFPNTVAKSFFPPELLEKAEVKEKSEREPKDDENDLELEENPDEYLIANLIRESETTDAESTKSAPTEEEDDYIKNYDTSDDNNDSDEDMY